MSDVCVLVETLWWIAALLQQVSHSLWKVKYKLHLYIIFISSKTNMLQCKLSTFMKVSTDNINLELKEVELEGADWIYVAPDTEKLLAFLYRKMKLLAGKMCLRNYQQN